MNRINKALQFIFWGLVLGLSSFLLLPRGEIVIFLNEHRTIAGDILMPVITYAGSVFAYIPFGIYYLIRNKKKVYFLIHVTIFHGIAVYTLKHFIFGEIPRPVSFFENTPTTLNLIEGLTYHHFFSFPSGHTTTAFAMLMSLCFTFKRLWTVCLGLTIALLVGFSRIYLLQHFFGDVYAGMVLGGICALVSYRWSDAFFERIEKLLKRKQ